MLGAFLSTWAGRLTLALALAMAAVGVQNWRLSNVKANYADYRAEVAENARLAAEAARKADGVAHDTVAASKGAVMAQNEQAREVAAVSEDPLKSGLGALK